MEPKNFRKEMRCLRMGLLDGGNRMKKTTFDAHTSRCRTVDTEEHTRPECRLTQTMTPAEMRQLRRLQFERTPEACLGCGLEHGCSLHGCAVLRKAYKVLGGKARECC